MASVASKYPFELGSHSPDEVLLDFEFKLDRDTEHIRFKQVRPFLIPQTTTTSEAVEFQLKIPASLLACASFDEARPNAEVLASKARLGLKAGETTARTDGTTPTELFEWLELSPSGPRVGPEGPGFWTAQRVQSPGDGLRCTISQDFRVAGRLVRVTMRGLFVADAEQRRITLDPPALAWATGQYYLTLEHTLPEEAPGARAVSFLPRELSHLPLSKVAVVFWGGDRLHFEERFQELHLGTGPAQLVHADVTLGGQSQAVEDYWKLVYSAGHHNDTP